MESQLNDKHGGVRQLIDHEAARLGKHLTANQRLRLDGEVHELARRLRRDYGWLSEDESNGIAAQCSVELVDVNRRDFLRWTVLSIADPAGLSSGVRKWLESWDGNIPDCRVGKYPIF